MDLILGKKEVGPSAIMEWKRKWTPALLRYSETLTGKQGALMKQNHKSCQGNLVCMLYKFSKRLCV